MSVLQRMGVSVDELIGFCRKNNIKSLSFFGSVLTKNFSSDSDIDVIVEFELGKVPGLLGITSMQQELSKMFNRTVDLRTPKELSGYFRDSVISNSEVAYASR